MKTYICQNCNKEFISKKGCKTRTPKYCSRNCFMQIPKTEANKLKMSIAKLGKEPVNKLPKYESNCIVCNNIIINRVGAKYQKKYCNIECYYKSLVGKTYIEKQGEKSHFWKGGVTNKSEIARKNGLYRIWQNQVFKRDNYLCQNCGKSKKDILLHAHHIIKFSENIEKRYDVNNGVTLCIKCHGDVHGLNFLDKNLTVCIDCGIKIKKNAKRCLNCLQNYRQSIKDKIIICVNCNENVVKAINRKCKKCSAKLRENNFGRTKTNIGKK